MSTVSKNGKVNGKANASVPVPTMTSNKATRPNNRFQHLWMMAEDAREENRLFEESLEALVGRVRAEIGPREQELGLALRRQLFKLITFSSRKSLLQWQRAVLEEWIESSMGLLEDLGLVNNELRDHFASMQARALNIVIDEHSEVSAVDQLNAALRDQLREAVESCNAEFDGDLDDEYKVDLDEDAFDFREWYDEQMQDEGVNSDGETSEQVGSDSYHEKKLSDSSALFKTLFHRAARAIHPDKVTDPKEKEARQVLMTQLLEARRNQDLMSIFELYKDYVDAGVEFAEQELAELEEVLVRFIAIQKNKQSDLIMQSPTHFTIHEQFYSKSQAVIKRRIKIHQKDISSRIEKIETFTDSVNSLKALKPHLEERYEEMYRYF